MLFLAALGKTELSHDIFFKFSVEPFELFEVEPQKKFALHIGQKHVWFCLVSKLYFLKLKLTSMRKNSLVKWTLATPIKGLEIPLSITVGQT